MLVKYLAVDLHYFGTNKHAFLSDDYWTSDEKLATFFDCPVYACQKAKDSGALNVHCIKVQFNWNN